MRQRIAGYFPEKKILYYGVSCFVLFALWTALLNLTSRQSSANSDNFCSLERNEDNDGDVEFCQRMLLVGMGLISKLSALGINRYPTLQEFDAVCRPYYVQNKTVLCLNAVTNGASDERGRRNEQVLSYCLSVFSLALTFLTIGIAVKVVEYLQDKIVTGRRQAYQSLSNSL